MIIQSCQQDTCLRP